MEAAAEAAEAGEDAAAAGGAPPPVPAASKRDGSAAPSVGQSATTLLAKGAVDAMISAAVDQSVLKTGMGAMALASKREVGVE